MTAREAARTLDLTVWTIWQLCSAGVIPSWRSGGLLRIHPDAVDAYASSFGAAKIPA
jgi:excisionase family DNA binding protein